MSAERFLDLYSRHRLPGQLNRGIRLDEERERLPVLALHCATSLQSRSASVAPRDLQDSASKILFGAPWRAL
jgi:hypothetical protein